MLTPPARFRLVSSPPGGQAAISVVEVSAESGAALEAALAGAGIGAVAPGTWGVRALGRAEHADHGVMARVDDRTAWLMPHAGPAVVSEVLRTLFGAGLRELEEPAYPEASSEVEAAMLGVLARAASPLAVDLLLDQPRRWRELPHGVNTPATGADRARGRTLRRLVDPPLVVAWGAPNIGKSSLLNALAGQTVALAADERGTTRDHVGATLDLAGLVVWYADTPGVGPGVRSDVGPDAAEAQAAAAARELAGRADLVLLCADATSGYIEPPPPPPVLSQTGDDGPIHVRVALRADLGPVRGSARADYDLSVTGPDAPARILGLARLIRDRLVPPEALSHPGAWAFWQAGEGDGGVGGRSRA